MKYFTSLASAIILTVAISSCAHKIFPTGNYQETTVAVDGDLNEWNTPLRFNSNGGQVQYNVTNDKTNLYISLQTYDEATAVKILRAGVNIFIDPAAKEGKKMNLAFPLPNSSALAAPNTPKTEIAKQDKNEIRQVLLSQANIFSVAGFKEVADKVYDVTDKSKIQVALKSGAGNGLGYEAVIPLKYIFGDAPAENISVGIVLNAVKIKSDYRGNNNNNFGGGMRGGGRGRNGGGNYNRSNTTDYNESRNANLQTPGGAALAKKDASWYSFKLAIKK